MKSLAEYASAKMGHGKIINTFRVPSKTTKGLEYTVEIDMYGNMYCDCIYPKDNCSHKKIIKYKYNENRNYKKRRI